MAVGDIINDVFEILAAARFEFQPAAGVEIIITAVGVETASSNVHVAIGTTALPNSAVTEGDNVQRVLMKMGITNTTFFHILNAAAGTLECGYTGIQIQ